MINAPFVRIARFLVFVEVLAKYFRVKRINLIQKVTTFAQNETPMVNKIINFIKHIAADKKLHFFAGFGLCALFSTFWGYFAGLAVAVAAGVIKEAYDYATGKGTPEVADFIYTAIGAIAFIIISVALNAIL